MSLPIHSKLSCGPYFEKPRTRFGWKGFGIDPDLNGQHNIAKGITLTRQLLNSILELHVPTATEFLDPNFAPYLADMICWGAIGARTTESQPHRQLVSALHCAVGFKTVPMAISIMPLTLFMPRVCRNH